MWKSIMAASTMQILSANTSTSTNMGFVRGKTLYKERKAITRNKTDIEQEDHSHFDNVQNGNIPSSNSSLYTGSIFAAFNCDMQVTWTSVCGRLFNLHTIGCKTGYYLYYNFWSITVFSFQVTPVQISLDDIDDLISALSPDEVKELSCVDPDVSTHKYHTKIYNLNDF